MTATEARVRGIMEGLGLSDGLWPDVGSKVWSSDFVPGEARRPNIARVYDFWLGGKDCYAEDRDLGRRLCQLAPWIAQGVRANRAFLVRVVEFLAESGVRQFLDVGSGLPTRRNVHQVAQEIDPACRVVYVDNDPTVLAFARALLAVNDRTTAAEGDLRDPVGILEDPCVRGHLDWSRPVAVMLVSMMHFLKNEDDPARILEVFHERTPPGSFLVFSNVTPGNPEVHRGMPEAVRVYNEMVGSFTPRTPDEITDLLRGWNLLGEGLVPVEEWQPPETAAQDRVPVEFTMPMVAGVARRGRGIS